MVLRRKVGVFGRLDVVLNHNKKKIKGVGPMCSHFNCLFLVDEEVVLVDAQWTNIYSFPLNRMGKVNHNRTKRK